MATTITLYTTPNCQQCNATKRKLNQLGLDYQTVDLTTSLDDYRAVKALGYTQAPVVAATVNGVDHIWQGFNPDKLNMIAAAAA